MNNSEETEVFWTTARRSPRRSEASEDRPLYQALAAARRTRAHDPALDAAVAALASAESASPEADDASVVIDLRPGAEQLEAPSEPQPSSDLLTAVARAAEGLERAVEERRSGQRDWLTFPADENPEQLIPEAPPEERTEPPPSGSRWRASVQGWVKDESGRTVWRPIITTTTTVPNWDVDTSLGMVTGESACAVERSGLAELVDSDAGNAAVRQKLATDREQALQAMEAEAVTRGAHAIIGVNLDYTFLGECLILTATGTAVTLRPRN